MPSKLVMISSAPARSDGDGFLLDRKFEEGMRFCSSLWDGEIKVVLPARTQAFSFGRHVAACDLPYELQLVPALDKITAQDIGHCDVLACAGDNHDLLGLWRLSKQTGGKTVYTIEYTPKTRRQTLWLDDNRTLLKKLYGLLWQAMQERRRRRAFREADGLQINGYPGALVYGALNADTLLYLDSRVTPETLATSDEMTTRRKRLLQGAPLRLLFSGRLEPMKGAQDLLPIARQLLALGVDFTLDVFGDGALARDISQQIKSPDLSDRVTYHGVVDYETELVPFARQNSDLFLSCHRQGDPSCTYLESMGCGLPVIGYDNEMWHALCTASNAGWSVPLGDTGALSARIAKLDTNRELLADRSTNALAFAREHLFAQEFQKRMDHLADIAAA